MNLREDEIAYLGTARCYCGHLYSLHNMHCCDFCLLGDENEHHFCSEVEEKAHYGVQHLMRGNPAVSRSYPCPKCQEEAE